MRLSRIEDLFLGKEASSNIYSTGLSDELQFRLKINDVFVWDVSMYVWNLLYTLKDMIIRWVPIIPSMRSQWRSWKKVRIKKNNLNVPVQNLFDHVMSYSIMVDLFWDSYREMGVEEYWSYIVFHDISELFYCDVPDFTSKHLAWKTFLTQDEKDKKENDANWLIFESLEWDMKALFKKLIIDIDISGNDKRFLKFTDKVECIVAVWRYIRLFWDKFDIEYFIESLTDFFDNYNIPWFAVNEKTLEFVNFFQNKDNARNYFYQKDLYWDNVRLNHWKWSELKKFINRDFMDVCR